MSYQMTTTERSGYVHFRVTGNNSPENVRAYLAEILATCQRLKCPVAMIEENLSGPSLDIVDMYKIASVGSAAVLPTIRAIAVVDVNPGHPHDKMQFAENVAVTRGINVRVFGSVPQAEKWAQNQAAALRAEGSQST